MKPQALERSRAMWNRRSLDVASDEVLAQLLDSGEPSAWRALYALAREGARLRARIARVVTTVPLPLPRFWLSALASLGESVDFDTPLPTYVLLASTKSTRNWRGADTPSCVTPTTATSTCNRG